MHAFMQSLEFRHTDIEGMFRLLSCCSLIFWEAWPAQAKVGWSNFIVGGAGPMICILQWPLGAHCQKSNYKIPSLSRWCWLKFQSYSWYLRVGPMACSYLGILNSPQPGWVMVWLWTLARPKGRRRCRMRSEEYQVSQVVLTQFSQRSEVPLSATISESIETNVTFEGPTPLSLALGQHSWEKDAVVIDTGTIAGVNLSALKHN